MAYYMIYGDSVAAGYGAPPGQGFADDIGRSLSQTRSPQTLINISAPGWTTLDVTEAIADTDGELGTAEFIGLFVGGDDLIDAAPAILSGSKRMLTLLIRTEQVRYKQMLALLRSRTNRPLVVGTLYNPYPNTPVAETAIGLFNREIMMPAAASAGVKIAPVGAAFAGRQAELISGYSDGILLHPGKQGIQFPIHPNKLGHRVIAQAYLSVL